MVSIQRIGNNNITTELREITQNKNGPLNFLDSIPNTKLESTNFLVTNIQRWSKLVLENLSLYIFFFVLEEYYTVYCLV